MSQKTNNNQETKINISPSELRDLMKEYDFNTDDILQYDDEQVKYFEAVKKLPQPDYIILLLYTHLGSQRKVGKLFNISHSCIGKTLKQIRKKIEDIMENNK